MSFFTMGGRPAATSPGWVEAFTDALQKMNDFKERESEVTHSPLTEVPATRREESAYPELWGGLWPRDVPKIPILPWIEQVDGRWGQAVHRDRQKSFFPEDEVVARSIEYRAESEGGGMWPNEAVRFYARSVS